MSGTLYISRNPPQPPPVATPNEPQEDRSAPPPPSEGPWLCDEPYKYHIKTSNNSLERCNENFERNDGKTYTQLKEEINFLMVVAGLFLAIVAAFTIESYKSLQEDKQDTMSDLLVEVVRLLNDTSAQGKAQLPKPFTPKHHAIVVNQLWFLSMILSLIAVAMGTFCLQWISALSRGLQLFTKDYPFHESLALRQSRYDGLDGWGVRYAPEALLFIVQLSIGLFVCGLVYFLWNVSEAAAIPTLVITSIAAASFCLINLLPFLQPLVGAYFPETLNVSQCPYHSPTSWFIYNAGTSCAKILSLFLCMLSCGRVIALPQMLNLWIKEYLSPSDRRPGFDWKMNDDAMRHLRTNVRSKFSYLESGLISALDRFPYGGEAKDIISNYLESLVPLLNELNGARAQKIFNSYNLPDDEIARLVISLDFTPVPPRRSNTTPLQKSEYANKIKTDFWNALILQRLYMRNNRRFGYLLIHYRLELYIRIKNSTASILNHDASRLDFVQSLECPLVGDHSINYMFLSWTNYDLDTELKCQFLRCVTHLIDTRRCNDDDILGALRIVDKERVASMTLSQDIQNLSGTQHMDPPAEEEHTGPLPNRSSPGNIQIGNFSDQPESGTPSSPPNDLKTGGPKSATHGTGAEDHQSRTSFESLCLEVREQLSGLRRSDFNKEVNYHRLRDILDLPPGLEPEPESVRTHTAIDVPDHEGT